MFLTSETLPSAFVQGAGLQHVTVLASGVLWELGDLMPAVAFVQQFEREMEATGLRGMPSQGEGFIQGLCSRPVTP